MLLSVFVAKCCQKIFPICKRSLDNFSVWWKYRILYLLPGLQRGHPHSKAACYKRRIVSEMSHLFIVLTNYSARPSKTKCQQKSECVQWYWLIVSLLKSNYSFIFAQEPNLLQWCKKVKSNCFTLTVRLDPATVSLFLISRSSLLYFLTPAKLQYQPNIKSTKTDQNVQ